MYVCTFGMYIWVHANAYVHVDAVHVTGEDTRGGLREGSSC